MGTLKLSNSSGNFVALEPPSSIASDVTLTLPNTDGDSGNFLRTDGSGALTWATPAGTGATWVTGTLTSLSGATVTITGIPSNAVKVLVTIQDSSISGTSNSFIRLGAGDTPVATNYAASSGAFSGGSSANSTNYTGSFAITTLTSSSHSFSGHVLITKIDTGDYVLTGQMHSSFNQGAAIFGGRLQLGGTLDRVQWGSGGSTFDAGQIRVDYLTQD